MEYDAIVVGGGPAGSVAAMYLKKAGKNVILLDKADFPRDKTCGDAQGRKAANIIQELGLWEKFEKIEGQDIYGIILSSPDGTQIEFDIESDRNKPSPGYVHKRMVFDDFLFESAKERVDTKNFTVTDVIVEDEQVKGVIGKNENGEEEELRAKIVLGADGAHSVVARKFELDKNPPEHFITALRGYYKNIEGLSDKIELHMIDSLIPGYFWIFPLPNKEANVGVGMIIKDMNKKKINLKEAMLKEIAENPLFKERFSNAELDGDIKGWSLPIASYHRKNYGNGFLLIGDAAGLIDPLTGEGIGNGMISGRIAAGIATEAIDNNDPSEKFLEKYDKELWDVIGEEIKKNYKLQRLGARFPILMNKMMNKAKNNEEFRKKLESRLPYVSGRGEIGTTNFIAEFDDEVSKEEIDAA